jgi:hypothetical protein
MTRLSFAVVVPLDDRLSRAVACRANPSNAPAPSNLGSSDSTHLNHIAVVNTSNEGMTILSLVIYTREAQVELRCFAPKI